MRTGIDIVGCQRLRKRNINDSLKVGYKFFLLASFVRILTHIKERILVPMVDLTTIYEKKCSLLSSNDGDGRFILIEF